MRDPRRASALPGDAEKAAGSRIYVACFVCFLVFCILVLVGIRLHLGIGWGNIEQANGRELVGVGLAHGVLDNLSYTAWAQQAKHGHFVFENLFTTEPHRPLMVNLLFWLVGRGADLLAASPLFVMVALSLPAAALTIVCVWLVCRRIGLHQRAALLATVFVAYGSGLSVPLLALLPHRPWYRGADSSFLDAIPATVFPFYPYHTISLALAAALLFAIVVAESSPSGRPTKAHLWLVFVAGATAVWSHPYEPTALLVVYGVLVLSTLGSERRAELLRLRIPILLSLSAAVLPAALYYFWITTEPVWSAFAVETWQIHGTRLNWLVGFGLFWPLPRSAPS
ncbi:MAG: hypothetical protein QF893_07820 [Alphaproteobacteria bacterium]|jgi:hypothetical protein|nr:hypothetical protein [Alphaproteobacteria bacterium]